MEKSPLISVIIPVYNGERFLAEAIESVLSQQYEPIELIVVDDGSTDDTPQVAKSFDDVQYIHQTNQGPASARNAGVDLSQGELIAFLDADDLWLPNKLGLQLAHLLDNHSLELINGFTQLMMLSEDEAGRISFKPSFEPFFAPSLGSALVRRSVFAKVGCFDESLRYCDDIDWYLRARETDIAVLFHQDVVQYYRQHEDNITREKQLNNRYLLRALKKSLDRRRSLVSDVEFLFGRL